MPEHLGHWLTPLQIASASVGFQQTFISIVKDYTGLLLQCADVFSSKVLTILGLFLQSELHVV